jgi:hypothetical protein
MKQILIIVLGFLSLTNSNAQSHIETYSTCDSSFTIKCEPQNDNSIQVSILVGNATKVKYNIWTDNMEVFAKAFQQKFKDSSGVSDSCGRADSSALLVYGRKLFLNYLASLQNISPNAGIFKVKDSLKLHQKYIDSTGKLVSAETDEKYKISRLQAEITDGYLENIIAYITNKNGLTIRFTMTYPMGMSSVNNFKKYFGREVYDLMSSPFVTSTPQFFITLSDLIDYDYYLGVKRRDYSPKDTVLDMQGNTSTTLHKEETNKLFEADVFTDFEGLNESNPNGLVQTEISKRININTVQYLSPKRLYFLLGSYGYAQYIAPVVSISKLEQHNKRLNVLDLDSVRLNPGSTDTSLFNRHYHRFADALALYQYQWFSGGVDFNLFYINNHDLKYNLYLNVGGRLGFTQITDSLTSISSSGITKTGLVNQYSVSTLQFAPQIVFNWFPEERFYFSISQKWMYFKPMSSMVQMVSYDKNDPTKIIPKSSTWINITELMMSIQMNPNNKLFGRLRYNWEAGNGKNNFAQIQVGYATYILGGK